MSKKPKIKKYFTYYIALVKNNLRYDIIKPTFSNIR